MASRSRTSLRSRRRRSGCGCGRRALLSLLCLDLRVVVPNDATGRGAGHSVMPGNRANGGSLDASLRKADARYHNDGAQHCSAQ